MQSTGASDSNHSIEVLDVQGRAVARIVDGTWPAGSHEARWTPTGTGRAPGRYLVRYRHPGGESVLPIVRFP